MLRGQKKKFDLALACNSLYWYNIFFLQDIDHSKDKSNLSATKNYLNLLLHYKHPQFLEYCKHIVFWLSLPSKSFFSRNIPGYYIPLKVPSLEIDSAEENKSINSIALLLLKNINPYILKNISPFLHVFGI